MRPADCRGSLYLIFDIRYKPGTAQQRLRVLVEELA